MRTRAWFITLNNPTGTDDFYEAAFRNEERVRYYCFQREAAPTTGTIHFHFYLFFERSVSQVLLLRLLPCLRGSDHEARRGTHEQCRTYCTKVETRVSGPYEGGQPPRQGKRTDIHTLTDIIVEQPSVTMRDLYLNEETRAATFKYYHHVHAMKAVLMEPRDFLTQTTWLYGSTGTGKSYRARLMASLDAAPYYKDLSTEGCKWWEAYSGQDVVIDDYASSLPYRQLLRIIDEYPLRVSIKGGSAQFRSKRLIITSRLPPWEHYGNVANKEELERRLEGRVYEMVGREARRVTWGDILPYSLFD